MKKKIKLIALFDNGNIAVCDEKEQIPLLQKNPIIEVLKKAKRMGYDVNDAEILLPFYLKAKVIADGKNYQVIG